MLAVKAKMYGVLYNFNSALSLLMKHLVIGWRQKAPIFSAYHWSLHVGLVSIGQHFIAKRVVFLPNRDPNELNYRIGPKRTLLPNRTRL